MSLCWMSFAECYAECHFVEWRNAICHFVECYYADCHHAKCQYAKCCGTIPNPTLPIAIKILLIAFSDSANVIYEEKVNITKLFLPCVKTAHLKSSVSHGFFLQSILQNFFSTPLLLGIYMLGYSALISFFHDSLLLMSKVWSLL